MATLRKPETAPAGTVPVELSDARHALWGDEVAWRDYMAGRGWPLPAESRLCVPASAARRRRAAVRAWAVDAGVTVEGRPGHPDWHRFRALGLL